MMRSRVNLCKKNRDDKRNVLYSWAVDVRGGGKYRVVRPTCVDSHQS
jgi:hypothetical protein